MSNQERLLPIGILEQSKKNQLKPAFEEGEFFLADYFNKKLPLDWTIFTRPEFKGRWGSNQSKKTPDLVLAHPKKGIMIFEVKNWNISNFFSEETETKYGKVLDIFQKNDKGRSGNKNPVLQAETYLWRMRDNVHEILEEIYENQNKRFLIRCGVYFHNPYSTDQARNFVKYNKFVNPDRCSVFAKDLLDSDSSLEQIMPLINNKFKINTDRDWLQSFKNWISPPLHRQEKQFRLSINDLDNNQKNFVLSKPNVVQKLSGVAGSGKTTIAALRASLSANENKKVLVLCYNITIKNFIKDEVERTIYIEKERIDFFHFHDFCKVYRENNNIIYPNSLDEEENDDKSVEEIIEHKIKNLDKSINYDVIIIDEGQDFKKNWYDLIRNFLNIDGEILIAIDQKQNIYRRKETALKGIGSGRWGILKKSYRLLNQHIELANKFSDNFLKNFKDDLETPAIDVEVNNQINLPFKAEPGSYWRNINNKKELNDFLIKIINDLFEKKIDPSDIAILVSNHEEGRLLKDLIGNNFKEIKIMDIFDRREVKKRQQKILFKVHSDKLKMSTIASFKGWDRRGIIIVTDENSTAEKDFIRSDYEFYTSLTRVREKLFILNRDKRYINFLSDNFKLYNN